MTYNPNVRQLLHIDWTAPRVCRNGWPLRHPYGESRIVNRVKVCEYTSWQLIKFAWILYVTYRFDSQVEFSGLTTESRRRTRLCQNGHPPTTNAMAKSLVSFIIAETSWLPILELFWWPAKEWGNRHCARLATRRPCPRRGSCHKKWLRDLYVSQ